MPGSNLSARRLAAKRQSFLDFIDSLDTTKVSIFDIQGAPSWKAWFAQAEAKRALRSERRRAACDRWLNRLIATGVVRAGDQ